MIGKISIPIIILGLHMALSACAMNNQARSVQDNAQLTRKIGYFPEEIRDNIWLDLSKYHEPNLFTDDSNGFASRHRLSLSGITCTEYVIRIDESMGGRLNGRVSHRDRCKKGPIENHRFIPSQASFKDLKHLILDAEMFKYYSESWAAQGDICLDGHQLLFERRNADGYHVSESNASCNTPAKVRTVAEKMIVMSGEKSALGLLIP